MVEKKNVDDVRSINERVSWITGFWVTTRRHPKVGAESAMMNSECPRLRDQRSWTVDSEGLRNLTAVFRHTKSRVAPTMNRTPRAMWVSRAGLDSAANAGGRRIGPGGHLPLVVVQERGPEPTPLGRRHLSSRADGRGR
jgi:hypothetical protein